MKYDKIWDFNNCQTVNNRFVYIYYVTKRINSTYLTR